VACRNEKNTLELTQLIATRTQDGREVVDIDKVGKTVALFVFTGIVILQAHRNLLNDTTLLLYISYCAGVAGFSSYLRAKAGVSNGGKEYANGTAGKA
jgi:hypothetical protein